MKMENEISAPQDGTIASIDVRKGDTVNSGDVLYTMLIKRKRSRTLKNEVNEIG